MSLGPAYTLARAEPGSWQYLSDSKPSGISMKRRIDDGYRFKQYRGVWWVTYVGHPVDVDVNPALL